MTKILAFAGTKQSGKSSACNFTTGLIMQQTGMITHSGITEDGKLIIPSSYVNEDTGNEETVGGVLDLQSTDTKHAEWLYHNIWPLVKIYNLADELKYTVHVIFGISMELLCGTEDDKNHETDVKWKDMAKLILKRKDIIKLKEEDRYDKNMTIRELLQYFGTNVCRSLLADCWFDSCLNRIKAEEPRYALIGDVRFPNEVRGFKKEGAKIILLNRDKFENSHESETSLSKIKNTDFDGIIDTSNKTIEEKNIEISKLIHKWRWDV
jgi:hypothetical protein